MRRSTVAGLVGMWLAVLVVTVVRTTATRSDLAGTDDGAALFVVVGTLPAMALAIWRLQHRILVAGAVPLAAFVSCVMAVDVLNDQSSTAAMGIPAVGFWAAVIIGAALGAQSLVHARSSA